MESVGEQFQRIEKVPVEWCRGKGNRIGNDGRSRHIAADRFMDLIQKRGFQETVDDVLGNRHDIGMVCLLNNNYGNNLTNYALYQVLNNLGYSVVLINYPLDAKWKPYEDKWALFAQVPYEQTDIAKDYGDKISLKELNRTCRMFLVASDQLLRPEFVEGMDYHTCLDWAATDKYKMAYAASFGMDVLEGTEELKKKMQYFLGRFQAVSVRERSGTDILKHEFGILGKNVMDPVFLCDKKYYTAMAESGRLRLPEGPYVGGYILDASKEKEAVIQKVQTCAGLPDYRIISDAEIEEKATGSLWNLEILSKPLVEEWLANILYSDFFVTDSFHGMCFALIFNKDFLVIMKKSNWRGIARIKSLLGMLELEERLIESEKDLEERIISRHIDYASVNKRLEQMTEDSRKWLIQHLQEGMNYHGRISEYDILDEKIDGNKISIREVKDRMAGMEQKQVELQQQYDMDMKQKQEQLSRMISMLEEQKELLSQKDLLMERSRNLEMQTTALLREKDILEAEKKNLETKNRNLETEKGNLEIKNRNLETDNRSIWREKKNLETELRSVYASHSWKLTGGFRKGKTVLVGLLHHGDRR